MSVTEAKVRSLAWKYLGYPALDILKSEALGKYGALSTQALPALLPVVIKRGTICPHSQAKR